MTGSASNAYFLVPPANGNRMVKKPFSKPMFGSSMVCPPIGTGNDGAGIGSKAGTPGMAKGTGIGYELGEFCGILSTRPGAEIWSMDRLLDRVSTPPASAVTTVSELKPLRLSSGPSTVSGEAAEAIAVIAPSVVSLTSECEVAPEPLMASATVEEARLAVFSVMPG